VQREMNGDHRSAQGFEFRPVISTPSTNKIEGHIAASAFNTTVLHNIRNARMNDAPRYTCSRCAKWPRDADK